jgi:hypothetical protein
MPQRDTPRCAKPGFSKVAHLPPDIREAEGKVTPPESLTARERRVGAASRPWAGSVTRTLELSPLRVAVDLARRHAGMHHDGFVRDELRLEPVGCLALHDDHGVVRGMLDPR